MKLLITTQAVDAQDPTLGFFVRWIEEFAKYCEEVTVICLRSGDYALPKTVRVIPLGKASRVVRALRLWRASLRFYRNYDAVFVHMNPEYIVAAGFLWKLLGKRIGLWYTHKSVNVFLRIAIRLADSVFTASEESFRLASSRVQVMGHGIDTNRPVPSRRPREGAVRLMTSGRISLVKCLEVLLDAYQALVERGMPVTFSVFGAPVTPVDKSYAEGLYAFLKKIGEAPESVFKGAVPHAEMPARRAAADYFLHASTTGSLDKAVLDAIMSGVIPVSSSEAYRELFGQHASLLLYPPGNATALADRIEALEALTENEREAIRTSLRARVLKEHSLQALIPAILKALQTL